MMVQDAQFFNQDITFLKGIGPIIKTKLANLGIFKIMDLLLHMPSRFIQRKFIISSLSIPNDPALIEVIPYAQNTWSLPKFISSKTPLKIKCSSSIGDIDLLFFRGRPQFYIPHYQPESKMILCGTVGQYKEKKWTIIHPEIILYDQVSNYINQPFYPSTAGLSQTKLRALILHSLSLFKSHAFPSDWICDDILQKNKWPTFKEALIHVHKPLNEAQMIKAQERLAFDELSTYLLGMQRIFHLTEKRHGVAHTISPHIQEKISALIPFDLTSDQTKAIVEIFNDLKKSAPMLRILQGDVGSGKTIVAVHALLTSVYNGYIGALMAPTEILARQHFQTISKIVHNINIHVFCLTSQTPTFEKNKMEKALQNNEAFILIGTHALLFEAQKFLKKMSVLVIDEQHRFGVNQRVALLQNPDFIADCLLMSATPIPRTQLLMNLGKISVSELRQKPANRANIHTTILPYKKISTLIDRLKKMTEEHHKIYWVCPLIEESENLASLSNAISRYEHLKQSLPHIKIDMIHGKISADERDTILSDFKNNKTQILVSTSVIEVGIDVPDATILIIENAERFGLSQLHQLRGRVGRGNLQSFCILIYGIPLTPKGQERLNIIKSCTDGFTIAEEDLRLREGGNILTTQQSGVVNFRCFLSEKHNHLMDTVLRNLSYITPEQENALQTFFANVAYRESIAAAG